MNKSTLYIAGVLYSAYSQSTGGVSAVSGQQLPSWDEMVADPAREAVVKAWCDTARASASLPLHIVPDQPEPPTDYERDENGNPILTQFGSSDMEFHRQVAVNQDKALRQQLDKAVQFLQRKLGPTMMSDERKLAMRALQTARHWLGEDLSNLGTPYPYPKGNDVTTVAVDPAADKAQ